MHHTSRSRLHWGKSWDSLRKRQQLHPGITREKTVKQDSIQWESNSIGEFILSRNGQGKLNQKSSTRISSVGEFRKEAHFLPKLTFYLERNMYVVWINRVQPKSAANVNMRAGYECKWINECYADKTNRWNILKMIRCHKKIDTRPILKKDGK